MKHRSYHMARWTVALALVLAVATGPAILQGLGTFTVLAVPPTGAVMPGGEIVVRFYGVASPEERDCYGVSIVDKDSVGTSAYGCEAETALLLAPKATGTLVIHWFQGNAEIRRDFVVPAGTRVEVAVGEHDGTLGTSWPGTQTPWVDSWGRAKWEPGPYLASGIQSVAFVLILAGLAFSMRPLVVLPALVVAVVAGSLAEMPHTIVPKIALGWTALAAIAYAAWQFQQWDGKVPQALRPSGENVQADDSSPP